MEMISHRPIARSEDGFTTPAAALALLVACSLIFVCARGISIGSRSGQIQYIADAGALAADNVVAEFVTAGQVVDSVCISLSLLGLTVYASSAVAAFIPGGQATAAELAQAGAKVMQARDKFAESAIRGLEAAQKALPAICAARATQVIRANAKASNISYAGTAISTPLEGIPISIPDDAKIKESAKKIEEKEGKIQEAALRGQEAQKQTDEAKKRGWRADCGDDNLSMFGRAKKLASLSGARNPKSASPERWTFSMGLGRAKAYYAARFAKEPGASAAGSPEEIGKSVARKRFYAYAKAEVSKGYVERSTSGAEIPHLVHLARNTEQIRNTFLFTEAIYPVSKNGEASYLHAYSGCPGYASGNPAGKASVSSIDSGANQRCPNCNYYAVTLGSVPIASTATSLGFEHYYRALVDAANDYASAVKTSEQTNQELNDARFSISSIIQEAVGSLGGMRYDPQPPGRYGCICVVMAPEINMKSLPFIQDQAKLPARIAISGATLAPDESTDQSSVISEVAEGLFPSEALGSSAAKTISRTWSNALLAYTNGCENIKTAFRKTLGMIPLVGTALSDGAVRSFENALAGASLQPPNLSVYKPVLANTSHIIARDGGKAANVLNKLKQSAQIYSAVYTNDLASLMDDITGLEAITDLLDDHGLRLASIPLEDIWPSSKASTLYLPVPKDIKARIAEALSSFGTTQFE